MCRPPRRPALLPTCRIGEGLLALGESPAAELCKRGLPPVVVAADGRVEWRVAGDQNDLQDYI